MAFRFLIGIAVLACSVAAAKATPLQDRMQACFQQIKQQEGGRAFRKGWSGKCDLSTEAQSYEAAGGASRQIDSLPFIGTRDECSQPLRYKPTAEANACGFSNRSSFAKGLATAVVRVPLSGGRCMHVIPLVLSDKTEGYSCSAARVRVACVLPQPNKDKVRLAVSRQNGATAGDIDLHTAPSPSKMMFQYRSGNSLFALMPAVFDNYGDDRSTISFIQSQLDRMDKKCRGDGHSADHCGGERVYGAERLMLEQLRRAWSPRNMLSAPEKNADQKSFKNAVRTIAEDPRTPMDQKVVLRSILANEVGDDSPYQLLDAITDSSGPSWGANQIDIGANDDKEIDLFWSIVDKYSGGSTTTATALKYRACLSAPIRYYYLGQLNQFYSAASDMNRSLRSEGGRRSYNDYFIGWLNRETNKAAQFGGLFRSSNFLRTFYVDVANQFGAKRAGQIKDQALARGAGMTCAQVASSEDEIVSGMREKISSTRRADMDRRVENIREAIRQLNVPNAGRANCQI